MGNDKLKKDKKAVAQAERITALKKLLTYYKEITETVREPFIILDKDLYVVTANHAFYHKFRVLKRDTEGRRIYDLGNMQWNSPDLRNLLEHILPKHRVLNNYEVTHDFPVIGKKTMLLNARQVDAKQLILLAMEDVTQLRRHEADEVSTTANLIKHRDRLQRLSDAKDEFISLASHQLRTPATAVKQYVGMLTQDYAGKVPKNQLNMLNIVYANNERQLEIIDDLLRIAKVDAGKVFLEKKTCDVVKQVEAVIKGQEVLFKSRGQKVVLNRPKKKVTAFIDQKLMRMVLENLLDNAGKYSQDGEKITVDIDQNKTYTVISVKDSGVGIRRGDRQKLFKKFSRIDNALSVSVRGTGLGLYWAKKILDLHEGSIEVTSKVNVGSTFIIKMPVYPDRVLKPTKTTTRTKKKA